MESTAISLFPKKPARDAKATGKALKLFSNYFQIDFDQKEIQGVNKYTVKFEPEIPDNSKQLRKDVLKSVRDTIKEKLEFFIDWGLCLYSLRKCADLPTYDAEHEGQKYKISIEWVQIMEHTDRDHMTFLKIFFNSMMRSLRFEQIGPKSFNPANAHSLDAHNVKVWPGFDARLIMKERGALLNVDVAFRVVRTDTALNYISQLRDQCEKKGGDWQDAISTAMVGCTVVTKYNQKTYRIERVDFGMSPSTTFDKQGTQVSYQDYYKTRYNETISDPNQPLLINKDRKTGNEVALIPELCQLTGLTDAMRADFRLMKDLAQIVHTDANRKVKECQNLFTTFAKNEKCKEKQKQWHLKFQDVPAKLEGYKYDAGNLVMGASGSGAPNTFDIEKNAREIDRKIQAKMLSQPAMKTWGIFHGDRDAQVANQFKSTMKQCLDQVGFDYSEAAVYPVKGGMRSDGWIKELKKQLKDGVQMVVLLIPGQKGKSSLYDDIKRFLLTEYPIPSQVVLANTISKGKNLRSIVSKILIQMNAKLGGIPWAVDNLPFMDKPTMICGLDVFHATNLGKKSVLALSASINNSATIYWSTCVVQDDVGQEASNNLCKGMSGACEAFKRANGAYPAQIIFYRDGVGEGQVEGICRAEINQIKQALNGLSLADTKLMYVNTSKRVNTRLFGGDVGRFQNPLPGTVVDAQITDKDVYEFYLVSVAAKQGMSTPTRYTVIYDTIGTSPHLIESLTYKLCFTYYNVSGAIKEPSVIRYAHRLAALVGERGGRGQAPPQPHIGFEQKDPSLYFI